MLFDYVKYPQLTLIKREFYSLIRRMKIPSNSLSIEDIINSLTCYDFISKRKHRRNVRIELIINKTLIYKAYKRN